MFTRERTMGMLRFVVVVGCLATVGVLTGTAKADPTNDDALTLTFFNCSGPAGTPTSFEVTKMPTPGVDVHVVGSTGLFKRTSFTDLVTGQTFTWGPNNDAKPLITCNVVAPSGHLVVATGFLTGT
jgi:hypothetical protein